MALGKIEEQSTWRGVVHSVPIAGSLSTEYRLVIARGTRMFHSSTEPVEGFVEADDILLAALTCGSLFNITWGSLFIADTPKRCWATEFELFVPEGMFTKLSFEFAIILLSKYNGTL